jgi:hypothetical protein
MQLIAEYSTALISRPVTSRPLACVPEDKSKHKNEFARVLNRIIAPDDVKTVAAQLGINVLSLKNILSGQRSIAQQTLEKKQWRAVLAQHCSLQWDAHKEDFERAVKNLPRIGPKILEPENKESFGYIVWCIIGGKNATIGKTAILLQLAKSHFIRVLHDQVHVTLETLRTKQWREKLSTHFPDTWKDYEADFEHYAKLLPFTRGARFNGSRSRLNGWPRSAEEVGSFIGHVLKSKGDTIADILPDVRTADLKRADIWEQIISGSQNVPRLCQAALRELAQLYDPGKNPGGLHSQIMILEAKFL